MDVAAWGQALAAAATFAGTLGGGIVWLMRRRDRQTEQIERKARQLEERTAVRYAQIDAENDELRGELDVTRRRYLRVVATAWGYVGQMRKAGLEPRPPDPEEGEP